MREKQFDETLRVRVPKWLKDKLAEEAIRRCLTTGSLVRQVLIREVHTSETPFGEWLSALVNTPEFEGFRVVRLGANDDETS